MEFFVIVNPASSGGATQKKWPQLRKKLHEALGSFEWNFTSRSGHATDLARSALRDGFNCIVAVGGDGTISETVNGFFDGGQLINPQSRLGIIDAGTGGDFRKNTGLPAHQDEQIAIIAAGQVKKVTLGHAEFVDHDGRAKSRYYIVICSFGISGEVLHHVNQSPRMKRYASGAAFALASIKALLSYTNMPLSIEVDGRPCYQGPLLVGTVCNGFSTGGGMLMAPQADSFDPELDLVAAGDMGFMERLMVFPRIYNGSHIGRDKIYYRKSSEMIVKSLNNAQTPIEIDGDFAGFLPVKIETRPAALRVFVPGP